MKRHNFKKQFGQNFLKNNRFVNLLINPLNISEGDFVIEIGPGDGMVTRELLDRGATVLSIEVDTELIPKLIKKFEGENFYIENTDILEVNFDEVLEKYDVKTSNVKIIGSLPYNISKDIIMLLLQYNSKGNIKISSMCFIVQDEVAKSYITQPPKMTLLSARTNLYSKLKKFESVPTGQFEPRPKVAGGILFIEPFSEIDNNIKEIEKLIAIGFSSPRKTLLNNLRNSNKYSNILEVLQGMNLSETIRPSELNIEQWKELNNKLTKII